MKKIAVLGCGTVGSGVVEVFYKNRSSIQKKSGCDMDIKYIYLRRAHPELLTQYPDLHLEEKFCFDFDTIANDPEINIVVEVMGGIDPAYRFVKTCLQKGKSVATANKELIANKGAELLSIAKQNHVNILFEASVGGGIPIIRPISQCLAANEIDEIAGILNGTTNFILTRMIEDQMSFEDALRLAQENGYAEKDPTADIEGIDACRKICILASLAFGKHVYPDGVYTEGITKIHLRDVEYIRAWGGVIKLLGRAKRLQNGRISAMVSPAVVDRHSQLAGVDDVFNAILVRGDAIGDVVFYGRGAGKMPTASAVVADVIDCAKHLNRKKLFGWGSSEEGYVADYRDMRTALYIRAQASKPDQALEAARKAFGEITALHCEDAPADEIAFITPQDTERELQAKLAGINGLTLQSVIRMTDY